MKSNTLLVAPIVVAEGTVPSTAELRRFLLELLPAAMVPAVFHVTDALPLTSSGKVDRRALMAADAALGSQQSTFVAPRNRTEHVLVEIWCEVLDLERVGVTDDFFALGGASTQALEVAVRANEVGLPLRPESMFVYGTIAELAAEYGPIADDYPDHREGTDTEQKTDRGTVEAVLTAPAPEKPVQARHDETRNTVIESLGVYLPARAVSTETVLAECANEIRIPLERLTGIKSRRVAGDDEFSIDLARKAVADCLARSSYRPEEIDLVISCNISRCDGPGHRFTFEPSTSSRLRDQCGLVNAVSFDISNACAGMFTGITVADAFLKAGLVRRALV
ncbi:MAG: phosphopantetheine-binding protein, partial [Pseudonocardiaceae bacterium]